MTPTSNDPQHAIRTLLSRPGTYGLSGDEKVEVHETHVSLVYLAGARAYKLKKAVAFPYLDFSTLEKRRDACQAELTINSRFSPALYIGLGAITRDKDGRLTLLEPEETAAPDALEEIEPLVVMERFDPAAQLDQLALRGELSAPLADQLGAMAAKIMAQAPKRQIDWCREFTEVVEESLGELDGHPTLFAPAQVAKLRQALEAQLKQQRPLLRDRAPQGRVRHCHGDLHLRNTVLRNGCPVPFDALEFSEVLATTDVLYDLAFLVMDLLHEEHSTAAARVLCVALSLTQDHAGSALLPTYLATRAIIRAKVTASLIAQMPEGPQRAEQAEEARRYLDLATRVLHPTQPRLLAIGGLSGTGKSSCALALAARLAPTALVIRSDVTRKALLGLDLFAPAPQDSYTPETSQRVYDRLMENARAALNAGQPVILDAVFAKPEERDACRALARELGLPFEGFWLEAPLETRLKRAEQRQPDASDADARVVRLQDGYVTGHRDWQVVDAGGTTEQSLAQITGTLGL